MIGYIKKNGIFLFPFLIFVIVRFVLDFNGLYNKDGFEYLRISQELTRFLKSRGELTLIFPTGLYYPLFAAIISFFSPTHLLALQLISVISFTLIIYYTNRILLVYYPEQEKAIKLYLFLCLVLSPFLLRTSLVVMTDMLGLSLAMAAIYHSIVFNKTLKTKHFFLFVIFCCLAIMSRFAISTLLIPASFYILRKVIVHVKPYNLLIGAMIVLLFCLSHYLLDKSNAEVSFNNQLSDTWSFFNLFKSSFYTNEGFLSYRFINLIFIFSFLVHYEYLFFGILILVFVRKQDFKNPDARMLLISILVYLFFFGGIHFQNLRYLMPAFPLAIVLLFAPFERLLMWIERFKLKKLVIYFSILAQLFIFGFAFRYFYHINKIEKQIALSFGEYKGRTIYTFGIDRAVRAYQKENAVVDMYGQEIKSFDKNGLVLFNEQLYAERWKNLSPMINWNYVRENYHLKKIKDLPDNWELYEIQ